MFFGPGTLWRVTIMGPIGFDYVNQAWVIDGRYQSCGHPEAMGCQCFGRLHAGELAPIVSGDRAN